MRHQLNRVLTVFVTLSLSTFFTPKAFGFFTELTAFYFSDSLKPDTEITNNRLYFDASIGMPLDRKERFVIAWSVSKLSYSLSSSDENEVSTLAHGPRLGWYIDKESKWSIFVTYNLFANATFTNSEALDWRGYSYKVDLGFTPMITNSMYLGARLNYYASSYNEQFDASNNFSEITTSQSMIFPTIVFGFRF